MKKSVIAWAAALALAMALTGCSADQPMNSGSAGTANSPAVSSADPARGSPGIGGGDSRASASPVRTPDVNDAEDGGGAGGTNDVDNDGKPESETQAKAYDRAHGGIDDEGRIVDNGDANGSGANNGTGNSTGGSVMDDIGNAAGDVARGAGNAVRDAGDAVGNAVTGR